MNEGAKTGIYWVVAVAMVMAAVVVSRSPEADNATQSMVGQPLFPSFTDPLAASVLRITTYNESQSEVDKFEVAKDEQTGVWSLPSRNNYPADAAEQMQDAANSLVGVKVLDIQTENPEDHSKLGVIEPNAESLEAGDEGVGRLVVLKGQNNASLASIIIGKPVKGGAGKRYVRVPGQDPVYVVNLDDKSLSTKFEDWIEKDLLQLSSIDISEVAIQNYDAALEVGNQLSIEKHFDAKVSVEGASGWKMDSLTVYDDQGEPKSETLVEGETLAIAKLNALKNALDELKIIDVAAKPKGMSENLKADKDLVSDQQAVLSLAQRGFFPVTQGDILSANGEMTVTLTDGVQYVLRFGNVKGIDAADTQTEDGSTDPDGVDKPVAGANRYLLVTTRVDESKFPPPELASIPTTVEEMEAMEADAKKAAQPAPSADEAPAAPVVSEESIDETEPEMPADTESTPEADAGENNESESAGEPESPASGDVEPSEGTTEQSGVGSGSGSGNGQVRDEDASVADETAVAADETAVTADAATAEVDATTVETSAAVEESTTEPSAEPTAEEKQERLEAMQEKITKDNQRKLDERKNRIEAAKRRVRELNGRFADWYYVIAEETYRQLRLSKDELVQKGTGEVDAAAAGPSFNFEGLGQ